MHGFAGITHKEREIEQCGYAAMSVEIPVVKCICGAQLCDMEEFWEHIAIESEFSREVN